MSRNILRLGLVQMSMSWDLADNTAKATRNIVKLAKQGAQTICLSEIFGAPYFCQSRDKKFFDLAETIPGPSSRYFGEMAKKLGVTLIISLFERADFVGTTLGLSLRTGGEKTHYYNTAITIGPGGKIISKYRKVHIPNDPENYYDEAHYFEPGNLGFGVAKTEHGRVATMVCFDQWFPEGARIAAKKNADIIFYPTAIGWLANQKGKGVVKNLVKTASGVMDRNAAEHDAWITMQRSHAIANNLFVAVANRVGREDHIEFWGTSFVADPYGRIIAKASTNKEENLLVTCDLNLIPSMRRDWAFLQTVKDNQKNKRYR